MTTDQPGHYQTHGEPLFPKSSINLFNTAADALEKKVKEDKELKERVLDLEQQVVALKTRIRNIRHHLQSAEHFLSDPMDDYLVDSGQPFRYSDARD